MIIKQEDAGKTGRFYIEIDGNTLAEMDYNILDDILLITHTEVDESLAGKGIGKQLVNSAVDYVRTNSMHIKSVCPFAKKVLERDPGYSDVYIS